MGPAFFEDLDRLLEDDFLKQGNSATVARFELNGQSLVIKRYNIKITIVLLNNDGGGIFRRLPIANYDPPFTDLILTPHGINFKKICETYGLNHQQISSLTQFKLYFSKAILSKSPQVLEVTTNSMYTETVCNKIIMDLRTSLDQLTTPG